MTTFRTGVKPHRRAAARLVDQTHRGLAKLYAMQRGKAETSQSALADMLGVHRSVISRQLRGQADISLSRVGELAWLLGYQAELDFIPIPDREGSNEKLVMSMDTAQSSNQISATESAKPEWTVSMPEKALV